MAERHEEVSILQFLLGVGIRRRTAADMTRVFNMDEDEVLRVAGQAALEALRLMPPDELERAFARFEFPERYAHYDEERKTTPAPHVTKAEMDRVLSASPG